MKNAVVHGARSVREVEAYLPENYEVVSETTSPEGWLRVAIRGEDVAGWTLDDYVIPRLASGLMRVEIVPPLPGPGETRQDWERRGLLRSEAGPVRDEHHPDPL